MITLRTGCVAVGATWWFTSEVATSEMASSSLLKVSSTESIKQSSLELSRELSLVSVRATARFLATLLKDFNSGTQRFLQKTRVLTRTWWYIDAKVKQSSLSAHEMLELAIHRFREFGRRMLSATIVLNVSSGAVFRWEIMGRNRAKSGMLRAAAM